MLARRAHLHATALVVTLLAALLLVSMAATAAFAAAPSPWWRLSSAPVPTYLPPGGEGRIILTASNLGDAETDGSKEPVTITDKLPPGLEATAIHGYSNTETAPSTEFPCEPLPTPLPAEPTLKCTFVKTSPRFGERGVLPYEHLTVEIAVKVNAPAGTAINEAKVDGGGAPRSASVSQSVTVSGAQTPFGIESYELTPENEGGLPDTQAGSHPFQLTATVNLNENLELDPQTHELDRSVPAQVKDLHFKLPPGLVGNATALPQCSEADFFTVERTGEGNGCPPDTAVGVVQASVYEPKFLGNEITDLPLFNVVPSVGEPARFGFVYVPKDIPVLLDTSVRTGRDYGVTVSVENTTQVADFLASQVTFWGVPGDSSHDIARGWGCLRPEYEPPEPCTPGGEQQNPPAFLTLPTSCTGPLSTTSEVDSWTQPDAYLSSEYTLQNALGQPFELDGCNRLHFDPSIEVAPDGQAASTPTGLTVGVHVPQQETLASEGLAQADVKDTTVTLPQGVQLSPSAADGLQSCSNAQVGFTGVNPESGADEFMPGAPSCPEASKIATVKIDTPLLPNPLEGAVYLAAPQNFASPPLENPFGSLVAMYLVAEDPVSGVLVKLPGKVTPNPVTGQIVSTFEDTPQLPFENLELHFFGGERAPLSTPALCGNYTTSTSIAPWSGSEAATPSSSFDITSGPNGAPCSDPLPFAPSLVSDTTNIQAGAFSALTTTLSREDGQQSIQSVQLRYPPGLSGLLSGVKLCGEAAANAGTCGPESEIGETIVSVGLGGDPFTVTGGKAYITEKYEGAPFGLSIVSPAKAGPFDLQQGRPVVVRAKIEVNPSTAALTVTTDEKGPHAIPTIIEGIPLQIKHVNVTIDRPGFTVNPTSCNPMAITGTIGSAEGASSPVSVPFQVANCANLQFAPKFAVSTSGKTSKADGASFTAKLSYPNASQGTQANIAKVKVDLPKQLPSRLTTLQKACLAAVFEANPANCPADSIVGHATVTTPLLPVSLNGPVYFVSHGGEAFPSLTMVLQGDNVTIDLVGTTFISKAGITSTTFKTVPDTPFNTFELILPEEKYSALAANGDLCTSKLAMPTAFVAQSGLEIHESTPISLTSCAKAKALTRAQKLTKALKACKKDKKKAKRASCKNRALKNYGSVEKKAKKKGGLSR